MCILILPYNYQKVNETFVNNAEVISLLFGKRLTICRKSDIIQKMKWYKKMFGKDGKKKKEKITGFLLWVAIAAVMSFIIIFSGMDGNTSDRTSAPIIEKTFDALTSTVVTDLDERPEIDYYRFRLHLTEAVRKTAHIFEYFCLSVLAFFRFRLYGSDIFRSSVYSATLCLLFAVCDEYHQTFVSDRYGCLSDVIIDFGGAVVGIVVCFLITLAVFRKRNKKSEERCFPND